MGTIFEDFSPELVQAVIELVEPSSWKVLRLVSRTLAAYVTPLLFRDVEAWIQMQSLQNLVSIARTSHIAPHVQTLTITNDYLTTRILHPHSMLIQIYRDITKPRGTQRGPSWIDASTAQMVSFEDPAVFDLSERFNGRQMLTLLEPLGWDKERAFKNWAMQKDLAIEQDEMMTKALDVDYLANALAALTNLSCIKLTSGGMGGPQQLSLKPGREIFLPEPHVRPDGRQLISLFNAIAVASAAHPTRTPKLTSLVMDKDFWEGVTGSNQNLHPDVDTLDPGNLTAALLYLKTMKVLELQADNYNSKKDAHRVDPNLSILLAGMPKLEDLILHNTTWTLLRMNIIMPSFATTSLRSLTLQGCLFSLASMDAFLRKQSHTLSNVHLSNIALLSGHVVELFTAMRTHLTLASFSLQGWLVEIEDDTHTYVAEEEFDDETFHEDEARRNVAREAIGSFVRRLLDVFPAALLDLDTSGLNGFAESVPRLGLYVVIGASKMYDSEEFDS